MPKEKENIDTISEIIFHSIEGKYPGIELVDIQHEVTNVYSKISHASTLKSVLSIGKQILTAEDDVNNQIVTLFVIDQFIDTPDLYSNPISFLHKIVYAQNIESMKRDTSFVEGFPGELTSISQIDARFMELESLVKVLALMSQPTIKVAAYLLAHVYATIIRIHFFKDGNGRAARFTLLYLLKRWGLGFITIPKVRNDPVWKQALFNAIQGDISPFASILETRLEETYRNHE